MLAVILALALPVLDAFACCRDANDPDSCWPLVNVADASACDPAAGWALCQIEGPRVLSCEPVELYCCAKTDGVGWLDACEAYVPGTRCGGTVVGKL